MEFDQGFFNTDDFEISKDEINKGNFGKVFIVTNKKNGRKYAAKKMNSEDLIHAQEQKYLFREISILKKIKHIAIINFCGINFHSFTNSKIFEPTILMEYMKNGSLQAVLNKERESIADSDWNTTKKYICLLGIADAMRYLHQHGILHRDLKPDNILLDVNYYPKVCDFGFSRFLEETFSSESELYKTSNIGTKLYMAPEIIEGNADYGPPVDVYAFAYIAYEVVTGIVPFSEIMFQSDLMFNRKVIDGVRPKFNEGVNKKMQKLISKCWNGDPHQRPSFEEIFNELASDKSFFIEDVDDDEIQNYISDIREDDNRPKINSIAIQTDIQYNEFKKSKNSEPIEIDENDDDDDIENDNKSAIKANDNKLHIYENDNNMLINENDDSNRVSENDNSKHANENDTSKRIYENDTNKRINEDDTSEHVNENDTNKRINENDTRKRINENDTNKRINENDTRKRINENDTRKRINENDTNKRINENDTRKHINENDTRKRINENDTRKRINENDTSEHVNENDARERINENESGIRINENDSIMPIDEINTYINENDNQMTINANGGNDLSNKKDDDDDEALNANFCINTKETNQHNAYLEVTKLLISRNSNIKDLIAPGVQFFLFYKSIIHVACLSGNIEYVKYFLSLVKFDFDSKNIAI